jgi:YD repeat-containing protein
LRQSTQFTLLVVLIATLLVPSVCHADIVFLYDKLGRLVRAIRPDGEAATWHYDAVGNILRITRESGMPQTPQVTAVSPSGGGRGTIATITITGFNLSCAVVDGAPGITTPRCTASSARIRLAAVAGT